jgi:hypothetical protein
MGDPAAPQEKQPEAKAKINAVEVELNRDAPSDGERTHEEL